MEFSISRLQRLGHKQEAIKQRHISQYPCTTRFIFADNKFQALKLSQQFPLQTQKSSRDQVIRLYSAQMNLTFVCVINDPKFPCPTVHDICKKKELICLSLSLRSTDKSHLHDCQMSMWWLLP